MTRDLYSNLHYKEVKCLVARLKNARGLFTGWARGSWLFFQVTSMFSLWCILNHELLEVFLCKRIIACRQLLSAANLQAKNRGWIKCHSRFIFSRCNSMHLVRWSVKKTSLLKTTTTFPISYSLHPGSKPDKSPSETGQAPPGVALSATGPDTRIRVRGSCSSTKDEERAQDVSAWGLLLRGLCPGCPRPWADTEGPANKTRAEGYHTPASARKPQSGMWMLGAAVVSGWLWAKFLWSKPKTWGTGLRTSRSSSQAPPLSALQELHPGTDVSVCVGIPQVATAPTWLTKRRSCK